MTTRVILLHGLWMPGAALHWFAARLKAAGFLPEIFSYHSIFDGPEAAVSRLQDRIRHGGDTHLVAHSLGGLIALHALRAAPDLPVSRVVCLGVPLCGSGAAASLARWPLLSAWLGRSAPLLRAGCATWPERYEVGMVAGALPRGFGALFAQFDDAHDGTVSVAETRAPGLADHVVIPASHSGLLFSADAAAHSIHFLTEGCFAPAS